MLIEGRRPLDPQPAHDRKTGPIDQRKILVSPRQPDLPRSLQIGYPHRLQHRNPTAHPVPESLRSQPPQTMPQQRRTFPPGHDRWSPAIRPPSESLLPAGCSHRLHPLPHTRPRHRRKGSSPPVPARSAKRFSDHRVFLSSDVRSLRPPQIENRRRIGAGLRTRQIARHQTPHVFRHGNAQFAGAFLHPTINSPRIASSLAAHSSLARLSRAFR